jgi:Zn-finger nucleic acid-binding protein
MNSRLFLSKLSGISFYRAFLFRTPCMIYISELRISNLILNHIFMTIKSTMNNMSCDNSCPVCLEQLDTSVTTGCNHVFCEKCIDEWFDRGETSCPLCRTSIKHIFSKGEKIRVVVNSPRIENHVESVTNSRRYNLLRRWVLIQWFAILTLALVLLMMLSINKDLDTTNEEIVGDLYSQNEELSECREKTSNLIISSILTSRDYVPGGFHFTQCNVPKYFLDRCL